MTTRDEVYRECDTCGGSCGNIRDDEHDNYFDCIHELTTQRNALRDRLAEAERAQCRAAVLVAQVVQAAEAYADAWVSGDDWGYDMDHALPNLITAVRAYRKAPL